MVDVFVTTVLAYENMRFSSLFAAGDVSRETFPAAKSEEKRMFSQATTVCVLQDRLSKFNLEM